ncbi:hypothetical protein ZWY2020_021496 [Hordeum vulgare]|nr:hypothetical protein ZWY2020_021496 [Hordeum vulgare]
MATATGVSPSSAAFHGECFVVGDNIDTYQIIPAEHLTWCRPSRRVPQARLLRLRAPPLRGLPDSVCGPRRGVVVLRRHHRRCQFRVRLLHESTRVALRDWPQGHRAEGYTRIFFRNSVGFGGLSKYAT